MGSTNGSSVSESVLKQRSIAADSIESWAYVNGDDDTEVRGDGVSGFHELEESGTTAGCSAGRVSGDELKDEIGDFIWGDTSESLWTKQQRLPYGQDPFSQNVLHRSDLYYKLLVSRIDKRPRTLG